MRWLRWTGFVFAGSVLALIVGAVVEGSWGSSDGGTNWVDQTFGFAMYLGAVIATVSAFVLIAAGLVVGTLRLARRLLHP
jgi:hypothetical protein